MKSIANYNTYTPVANLVTFDFIVSVPSCYSLTIASSKLNLVDVGGLDFITLNTVSNIECRRGVNFNSYRRRTNSESIFL